MVGDIWIYLIDFDCPWLVTRILNGFVEVPLSAEVTEKSLSEIAAR